MIKQNSYYAIGCSDFYYLRDSLSIAYCNQCAVQAQQVAEKMLKSVAELTCVDIEKLMLSHNLRALYDAIHQIEPEFKLDRNALSTLKDYYFDAKYPGDNYVIVTICELKEVIEIMLDTVTAVENWRKIKGLPVEIGDVRKEFSGALERLYYNGKQNANMKDHSS